MRRLAGQIILNTLTAVSLLLCVATVAIWARSYRDEDVVYRHRGQDTVGVTSARGSLIFTRAVLPTAWTSEWRRLTNRPPTSEIRRFVPSSFLGFAVRRVPNRVTDMIIPDWSVFVVTALLPAHALTRRMRRRPGPGCCTRCRYDLTGNVSGVCPECGTRVATATEAEA